MRKRLLETGHIIETNSSIGLSTEFTVASIRRAENEYLDLAPISAQHRSIDRNEKITIRIDPESSVRNDRNYPGLNVIRNEFEIASKEQRSALRFPSNLSGNSTTDGQKLRVGDHLTEVNRRTDHPENKSSSSKISRIARDREYFLGDRVSKNIHAEENVTGSVSESNEEGNRAREKNLSINSVEDVSTVSESKFSTRENTDRQVTGNSLRRGSSRIRFTHNSGAVTAVAMVAIGAIMLLIGPIVIILRILDERKQARKMHALSAVAREDLPPTYEQAVFSSEAPRYSTLALNDDNSLPSTPPPSPTFIFESSSLVIKSHST